MQMLVQIPAALPVIPSVPLKPGLGRAPPLWVPDRGHRWIQTVLRNEGFVPCEQHSTAKQVNGNRVIWDAVAWL